MMYQMDDEAFRALRVILDDYCRDDPAGTRGGDNPTKATSKAMSKI
jgi:hypothetical protein